MMQPMMQQPPSQHQSITVAYAQPQPQPVVSQPIVVVSYVKRNPYFSIAWLFAVVAFFITFAFITPGWRKIVLSTNTDHGLNWSGSGRWYTAVGIGVYMYVVSNPNDNWAPPVVGEGQTAQATGLSGNCTIGSHWYTTASGPAFAADPLFFDDTNCEMYHNLQILTLICFFFTIFIPALLFSISSAHLQWMKFAIMVLVLVQEGFIVAIFIVSDKINWRSAQNPPEYGDVHIHTYAFSFAFFCLGAGLNSIAVLSTFIWAVNQQKVDVY